MGFRLAIAMGDPAGIGPEVVLQALAAPGITHDRVAIVGSQTVLEQTYQRLRQTDHVCCDPANVPIVEVAIDPDLLAQVQTGVGSRASGAASFAYLNAAIDQTLAGQFQGIVTGPIAKSTWKAAGHDYPGQTELLAERAGCDQFGMLFVARSPHTGWRLLTLLATVHIPLRQVPDALSPALMRQKLALLHHSLRQDFGLTQARVAIAGLNPHSGEQGQLGREEQDWLCDWLAEARQTYPDLILDGPVPPDTLWVKPGLAWYGGHASSAAHDAYLALYHDQGLIPVKLLAFEQAVNTTIGLPFIRTSPDHGTAFDIAGKGLASAASMKAAIQTAQEILTQRAHPSFH